MRMTIIGIDCATDARRVGLALGCTEGSRPRILETETGGRARSVADVVAGWIPAQGPTLLALDAPLGWPSKLGDALFHHAAGMPIDEDPNQLFRRVTDRVVKQEIGRLPLDVGADRIARTAHAALRLLQELREITGESIPLAWSQALPDGPYAIEVYPAATLTVRGIPASGYKERSQEDQRRIMLTGLGKELVLPTDTSGILSNADVLDAVVCVLAAADFLAGNTIQPIYKEVAEKEGWIWVRAVSTTKHRV